ncbi:MAG TPA: NAD(P)/FAD-dependent oxidoreductase [Steroidobacteraceae bacterium]|nr:NAD(P)/FAD-dependent oxidoreductase [Steroidobacteraceae bacterium]
MNLAPSADVIIIGGGPAGASAAAVLAERGRRVTLLEKSRHPRFHIGESLLPANLPVFQRLGIAAEVRAVGLPKWGVEFHSPSHDHTQSFRFADSWRKDQPHAYEVRRSELDAALIRRAGQLGAQVLEGCRAREVELLADGVRVEAEHESGERTAYHASYLIDASGRDTFLANRLGTKRRNRRHNSSAIYAHFSGAWRHEDPQRAGDISIFWFEHGWFWYIPLADGVTSVGAVVWPYYMKRRSRPVAEYFLETIALCPPLAERLKDAKLVTDVEATGNYAYRCTRASGERFLLIGDAYTFIDPVFSSGVYFATVTGCAAAEALDECLLAGKRRARAFRRFERISRHGPKSFSWFIYRMTSPAMRDLFMAPRNVLRIKEALLSLLAGDIYGTTPIWAALRAFKLIYYIHTLAHPRRSLAALRARVSNIRPIDRPGEAGRAAAGG